MESFSVRTSLTVADWNALMLEAGKRLSGAKQASGNVMLRYAPTALWLLLVVAFIVLMNTQPPLIRPLGLAIVVAGFFGIWWAHYLIQRRAYVPSERGSFLGDQTFDFSADGFRSRRASSDSSNRWSLVREISHSEEHVFIWIDQHSAYVVPARDLPAPMTAAAVVAQLQRFIAAAAAEPVAETAPASGAGQVVAPASPMMASTTDKPAVAQELLALLHLHAWSVVDGARLYGRDATLILLGLLSLGLWIGLDRLGYEGEVDFFPYGAGENALAVLGVLALAWLLSRASRPGIAMRQGLLLVLGFAPIYIALLVVAGWLPNVVVIVLAVLVTAWGERFIGAGLRSMTGTRQWKAATATLLGVLALLFLSSRFYFSPGFWIERPADTEQAAETQRQNEQLMFEQSSRINADVSGLAPRDPGGENFFFLGFAGYGGERVFAEEIRLAEKRVGERYGSAQRSLQLVNDHRDSLQHPLANVPALRHALNALSQRMNLEEDVLFLSLSSHGSEDGAVSVSSDLGYWRDLKPVELADMLREAGIRWRVIVVSACYSGAFIEPLRDDQTIILTAAAADRTSFGCADENDLTYFGEAFYRDALPKAASLRAAFDAARVAIANREESESRTPSNPQAYFGKLAEEKLHAIEQLRGR